MCHSLGGWLPLHHGSHTAASWAHSTRRGSRSASRSSHNGTGGSGAATPSPAASRGEVVRAELRGEVARLTGQDHCAVGLAHHQRLVAGGVPRYWHDPDVGEDLRLAVDFLIPYGRKAD